MKSLRRMILTDEWIKWVNLWPDLVPDEWYEGKEAFLAWADPQPGSHIQFIPGVKDSHYLAEEPSPYMGKPGELYIGPRAICMTLQEFAYHAQTTVTHLLALKREVIYDEEVVRLLVGSRVLDGTRFESATVGDGNDEDLLAIQSVRRRDDLNDIVAKFRELPPGGYLKWKRPQSKSRSLRAGLERRGLTATDYTLAFRDGFTLLAKRAPTEIILGLDS